MFIHVSCVPLALHVFIFCVFIPVVADTCENYGCEQGCRNVSNGVECTCNTGYTLNSDGKTCTGMENGNNNIMSQSLFLLSLIDYKISMSVQSTEEVAVTHVPTQLVHSIALVQGGST